MPEPKAKTVDVMIAQEELEKLKLIEGAVTLVKGYLSDGKLTVTGIQHELPSVFMHNWPSGGNAFSHDWPSVPPPSER